MIRTITACGVGLLMMIACEQRKDDDVATTRNDMRAVEPDNAKKKRARSR